MSVVVPVYGNATTVESLHERIVAAVGAGLREVVYVDDASPDGSMDVLARLAHNDQRVRLFQRATNGGQHRALLDGLRLASGPWVVTIDADLQDPPEAIPALLRAGADGPPVVFGGRRGCYEPRGRRLSSWCFKHLVGWLAHIPTDASTFLAMRREVASAVGALEATAPFLTTMIAATGVEAMSVPVARTRSVAPSGYSTLGRVRSAVAGLRWAIRTRRRLGVSEHNRLQLEHYAADRLRHIQPAVSRFNLRQVHEALQYGQLRAGEHVLDVGCGLGRATLLLADAGLRVEGLDLSSVRLGQMRSEAERRGISVHCGDVCDPPRALRERFDAVSGFCVLHHLHDLGRGLSGVRSLLRPGGRIVFVEPNALCPLFYLQIALVPGMSFTVERGLTRMRPTKLREVLTDAGFEAVRMTTFGLLPPFAVNRPRGAALERLLEPRAVPAAARAFLLIAARRPNTTAAA